MEIIKKGDTYFVDGQEYLTSEQLQKFVGFSSGHLYKYYDLKNKMDFFKVIKTGKKSLYSKEKVEYFFVDRLKDKAGIEKFNHFKPFRTRIDAVTINGTKYLRPVKVAKLLGLTPAALYKRSKFGTPPIGQKIGSSLLYSVKEIQDYLDGYSNIKKLPEEEKPREEVIWHYPTKEEPWIKFYKSDLQPISGVTTQISNDFITLCKLIEEANLSFDELMQLSEFVYNKREALRIKHQQTSALKDLILSFNPDISGDILDTKVTQISKLLDT